MKKRISQFAASLLLLIAFTGCGGGRPSAESVDSFMESLTLRIDMAKKAYESFQVTLPDKGSVMAGSMAQVGYDMMINSLKEQQQYLDQTETFESDEVAKTKSEALKKATQDILDAYKAGTENELAEVLNMAKHGKTMQSDEMAEGLSRFEEKLAPKYEAFAKIQAEFAKAFNITLI